MPSSLKSGISVKCSGSLISLSLSYYFIYYSIFSSSLIRLILSATYNSLDHSQSPLSSSARYPLSHSQSLKPTPARIYSYPQITIISPVPLTLLH